MAFAAGSPYEISCRVQTARESRIYGLVTVILAIICTCTPELAYSDPLIPAGPLILAGEDAALGGVRKVAAALCQRSPQFRLDVIYGLGSTGAVRALLAGKIDVAISGKPLTTEQSAAGLVAHTFSHTAMLFAVSPTVTMTSITSEEVAALYRGDVRAWPDGIRVHLVLRGTHALSTDILRRKSPEMTAAVNAALTRCPSCAVDSAQEEIEAITSNTGSFGAISLSQSTAASDDIRPLSLDGIVPSLQTVASGTYPLVITYTLVLPAHPSPGAQALLDFIKTPEARALLLASGQQPAVEKPE